MRHIFNLAKLMAGIWIVKLIKSCYFRTLIDPFLKQCISNSTQGISQTCRHRHACVYTRTAGCLPRIPLSLDYTVTTAINQ